MNTQIRIGLRLLHHFVFNKGRELPTFLIIGTQKGGTSSLFEYLLQHPRVQGSFIKEVQFFTGRHWVGRRGYKAFFPRKRVDTQHIAEATPLYLFSPDAPPRIHAMLPQVKLIALLREPVERAYSNYMHNRRRGHETRTFEECIAADIASARISGGPGPCPGEDALAFRHRSYVRRGLYAQQLERWYGLFPRENIRIFKAEDFFADPAAVTEQAMRFLGLPDHPVNTGKAYNQFSYDRKRLDQFPDLAEYYRLPNEQLKALTGIDWDAPAQGAD